MEATYLQGWRIYRNATGDLMTLRWKGELRRPQLAYLLQQKLCPNKTPSL